VAFFAYDYLATLFRTPDREGKTLLRARVEMENLCSAWFSVSSKVLGFLLKICFFLLRSNFRNVCCITVFSIQEYSNFTCVMWRVSSQYS